MDTTIAKGEGFKQELEPLFQMLEAEGRMLPKSDWMTLMNLTKNRVIHAPDQYLSGFQKPDLNLGPTIDSIFEERLN